MDTATVVAIVSASGTAALVTGVVTIIQGRLHARDQMNLSTLLNSQQINLERTRNEHDERMHDRRDKHEIEIKRLEYDLLSRAPRAERLKRLLASLMAGTMEIRGAAQDLNKSQGQFDFTTIGDGGRRGLGEIEGVRADLMLEPGCEPLLRMFDDGALRYFAFFAKDIETQERMVAEGQPYAVEAQKHARESYEDLLGQLEGLERAARELISGAEGIR